MNMPACILCVEDQADLLDDLLLELRDHGYRAEGCRDGLAALTLLGESHFDLMICDIQLPGLGGIELLNRIRTEKREHSNIPAVLLSAYGDQDFRRAGREQGVSAQFVKPVDYRELLVAVEEILSEKQKGA
ncbi:response regulator [Novosphingobium sp. B1]|uniref:response regulator n=1 Tax=Novosphingobium sp. B1 TaxID=1938756 RepID=UPI0009D90E10|nr:response regulator [Novosphingobium sp. B1]SMC35030.1 Response regulator receiver domain-containing protein [Novosphingobium sp. B1]